MFLKILIISLLLIALAVIGMGISILIKKNGKFPELHIGRNKHLKKKGISCAVSQDKESRNKKKIKDEKKFSLAKKSK